MSFCLHVLPEVGKAAECSAAATADFVAAPLVRDLQAGRPGGELHQLHDLDAVGLSDLLLQHPAALCGRSGEPSADCWPETSR